MTKRIEEWEPAEDAVPEKQNRIHRQLKKYGAYPIDIPITVDMNVNEQLLDTATGNTYGTRTWGVGTYGS